MLLKGDVIRTEKCDAMYQRLVNVISANHLDKKMEVYIDNMMIKSLQTTDYISHLANCFSILRQYNMHLNPSKYSFGVSFGKFLGYLVNQ